MILEKGRVLSKEARTLHDPDTYESTGKRMFNLHAREFGRDNVGGRSPSGDCLPEAGSALLLEEWLPHGLAGLWELHDTHFIRCVI